MLASSRRQRVRSSGSTLAHVAGRKKRPRADLASIADPDAMWVKLPLSGETVALVRHRLEAVCGLIDGAKALLGPVESAEGALRSLLEGAMGVAVDVDGDVKRLRKAMAVRRRSRQR